MNSSLIAVAYPDSKTAFEVAATLSRLQKEYLVKLEDLAVVTKDEKGKLKLHQSQDLVGAGALGGAFWGMLFGLLFLVPFVGAAVGAATGALSGALTDIGIDDNFMRDLAANLSPNSSALFVLVVSATEDKVLPEIAKYGGTVLKTSLSTAEESKWREALSGTVTTSDPKPEQPA
jgi:uncharacterized membrane protein